MLPLIGILGGGVGSAVGGAVARLNGKRNARQLSKKLEQAAQELDTTIKTLEAERQRVEELKDGSLLAERLEEERTKVTALEFTTAALTQEKQELERQLYTTKLQSEADLESYRQQIDALKCKVSEVINRLLAKSINETEASRDLEELGCHVDYVETEQLLKDETEWNVGQTGLLLEDKERMRRLITNGMPTNRSMAPTHLLSGGAADGASSRLPVVTFPQLKAPPSRGIHIPPLRLQEVSQQSSRSPVPKHLDASASDAGIRDQLCLSLGVSPDLNYGGKTAAPVDDQTARLEHLSKVPKIKFVYSAQGKQNNTWVAKLPVEGSTAPPAFMTSTSPVPTYRPERDDALLTSNDVALVSKW